MKNFYTLAFSLFSSILIYADEGMWIPLLLQQTCYDDLVEQGLLLSVDDIYNENDASIKDAVVSFGGCTGVIVSNNGLLFTNHHCGYSYVQEHSTLEHNYIEDGFWAKNRNDELPNPRLSVKILVKMEDVTEIILSGVTQDISENQRKKIIDQNTKDLIEKSIPADRKGDYQCAVRSFYNGNQFFVCYYDVFQDVRLVGSPPTFIGKFGGSTDNWTWPRHTGDFAVFRIYANKENKPAAYSPENIPYHPKKFIPISIRDSEDDNFSWVMGFPAMSNHFTSSYALEGLMNQAYFQRISFADECLKIWDKYMKENSQINIQYAAKYASLSNAWKKWKGTMSGIMQTDYIKKLRIEENRIAEKMLTSEKDKYIKLLSEIEEGYKNILNYETAFECLIRGLMGIEILQQAETMMPILSKKISESDIEKIINQQELFYKDYNNQIDMDVFIAMVDLYFRLVPSEFHPDIFNKYKTEDKLNVVSWAGDVFSNSVLTSHEKINNAFRDSLIRENILDKDPAFLIIKSINDSYNKKVWTTIGAIAERIDSLQRIYTKMLCEIIPSQKLYPDANHTMRISYGKKEGYDESNTSFQKYTYLDGVIEKTNSGLPEYQISDRLISLYSNKDFGEYAQNGFLPVCFITSAHTTSGNSGSPVFNSRGELIGLNFDRNMDGTMSDIVYDSLKCRNIVVDVRYILFVIDKYAEAKNILNELVIVK